MHSAADDEAGHGDSPGSLAAQWATLHAAADVVASLAGRPTAAPGFPLGRLEGWRLDLARQGLDDIAAIMEPGLSALLTLHAQGGDPRPAATALWQEFDRARAALLSLARDTD